MPSITNFQIRFGKIKYGTYDFGLINEIKLKAKPVEIGRDSYGRTVIGGYDVSCEFNILGSDNITLNNIYQQIYSLGSQTLEITSNGGKIYLPTVLLNLDVELDISGKPSKIIAKADRYFTIGEIASVFNTTTVNSSELLPPAITGA